MNAIQPTVQTVSGHIDQFRKITSTLATFRVNGIACKAEHHAVAYVERWSKQSDCTYEFQGAYQQSRFGREFVVAHGHPEAPAASSISPLAKEDVGATMRTVGGSPTRLEAATALSATETIVAEGPLGRGTPLSSAHNSSWTAAVVLSETVPVEAEQTGLPSRDERFEPLIQQQMKIDRICLFSVKELKKRLGSGSPIAREAARRILAERSQLDIQTVAA